MNARGVNDIRHTDINTAEQLVPEHNPSEFDIAVEISKHIIWQLLKKTAELLQADYETLRSEFRKLINSVWNNKNCFSSR